MTGFPYITIISLTAFFFCEAGSVGRGQEIARSNPSNPRRHSQDVLITKLKQDLPSRVVASDNGLPSVARIKRKGRRKKKRRNIILSRKTSIQKRKNSNVAGQDASHHRLQLRIQKQLEQKLKERRKKAKILKRKRAQAKASIKRKKQARKKKQKEKQKALLLKRKRQKARKAAREKARQLRRKNKLRNKKKTKTKIKPKKSKKLSTSDQTPNVGNVGSQVDLTNSLDVSGLVLVDPSQMRPTVFKDNWAPSLAAFQPATQENILDQNNLPTGQHLGRNISVQNFVSAPFQRTIVQKNMNASEDEVQVRPHDVLHDNASNTNNELNDGQTGNSTMGHSTVSPLSDLNSDLPLDTLNETFHEIPEQPLRVVSFQDVNIGSNGTIIFLNEQNISSQSAQQDMFDINIHDASSPIATHPAMGETLINKPKLPGDSFNSQLSPVAPPERQKASGDSFFESLFKDIWVQLNDAGI